MTFGARHLLMFSGKLESRLFVSEFRRRFPSCKFVTAFTRVAELSAMLITVTTNTFLRKAEKGFRHAHVGVGKFFLNEFWLMTITTRQLRMLPFQHITGEPMREICLALFPNNQREIFSVMLAVAGGAQLGFILRSVRFQGRDGCMKAALILQPFRNRDVALEALRVARLFAGLVTLQTLR